MTKGNKSAIFFFGALLVFDLFLWQQVFAARQGEKAAFYVLDVGQGDSELLVLPGGVKVMTDAGPDRSIAAALGRVLRSGDRYIDVAVISHPQLDHYGGFLELLDRYHFGVFATNGRSADPGSREWELLMKKIREKNIPIMTLGAGDSIRYQENIIDILAPDAAWLGSGELNDSGIVERIRTPEFTAFLAADIGTNVEEYLAKRFDLSADILKVGHHGSKYSSDGSFLAAVGAPVALIGVGEKNSYGHPSPEAITRIQRTGAKIFRTDKNGTVKMESDDGTLSIFTERTETIDK